MPLAPGDLLGHYKILAPIGEGGMGAVYRARDTKLDRDVAVKVLPEAFAGDPERLGRFEREAKVLASLNHPNIAAIYGVERTRSDHGTGRRRGLSGATAASRSTRDRFSDGRRSRIRAW